MARAPSNSLQLTLFAPESAWKAPSLSDLPSDWTRYSRIALDTETRDDHLKTMGCGARRGAYPVGYSFCPEGDRPWYVPLKHFEGGNVEDPEQGLRYLREQAALYEGEIVGAKLDYDLDILASAGIVFPRARFLDVQVAEPLIDELQFSYSLDSILQRHGLPLKDESLLREAAVAYGVDPKKDLWKLPARYVGAYAEADVQRPLELLRKQEAIIERVGLQRIWQMEQRITPILVKMRRRGVAIDQDQLDKVERFAIAEETKAWGEVLRHTGVNIKVGDAMKAEVVAQAFRAVDIEPPRTAKGSVSIEKNWLENLKHPVGGLIRRARKMSQLRTTFVASVRQHTINGRIHCTFNQIKMEREGGGDGGAAYGRLSCSDPNLQQQPARDPEIGPMWRKVYIPDQGKMWASLDYSQQEPRLALHTAIISGPQRIGERAHASALAAAQRYWADRNTDSHTMFVQMVDGDDIVTKPQFKQRRTILKNTYLGICYGMGGPKLCRELGYATKFIPDKWNPGALREVAGDEGQALLDLVDEKVPYVRATAAAVEAAAKAKGYVITLMGRHCHFPPGRDGRKYDWTHKAFNRVIQGGAADQTKWAMIALDEAGAELQLQVHDEFDESVETREEAERHAEIMENCVELKVPSKVDLEVGPSWGEVK